MVNTWRQPLPTVAERTIYTIDILILPISNFIKPRQSAIMYGWELGSASNSAYIT